MRAKILIIDNYDSFTYNLVSLIEQGCGFMPDVIKNDAIVLSDVAKYDGIVLSPGPGLPGEAGLMPEVLKLAQHKNLLGVCLGHQAIAEHFGAKLFNAEEVFHGVATPVFHDGSVLFEKMPATFTAGRYHSWMVQEDSLPDALKVTARDAAGNVMAIQHTTLKIFGVQFHPESIMTPEGAVIINNWLKQVS